MRVRLSAPALLPRRLPGLLTALLLALPACCAAAEPPQHLKVCADASELPPFTYRDRGSGAIGGYNIALLRALLAPTGRSFDITMQPWLRCLKEGAQGQFDIVLDGMRAPARERDFLLGRPHHQLSTVVLHLRHRPIAAPQRPADLRGYKQCHVNGWDNTAYGLPPPSTTQERPITLTGAIAMLRAGRCEFFLFYSEYLKSPPAGLPEAMVHSDDLAAHRLPWAAVLDLHLMVSRALPHAEPLRELMDQGLAALQKSGEAERLMASFQTGGGAATPP